MKPFTSASVSTAAASWAPALELRFGGGAWVGSLRALGLLVLHFGLGV